MTFYGGTFQPEPYRSAPERPDPAHFTDDSVPFADGEGQTLCGQVWTAGIWRNNPKADCQACVAEWKRRTGWAFPLPEIVA